MVCKLVQMNLHELVTCKGTGTKRAENPGTTMYEVDRCNCNGDIVYQDEHMLSFAGPNLQMGYLKQFPNATIFFNEGPLPVQLFHPECLTYVTMLRHPLERSLSHMMHAATSQAGVPIESGADMVLETFMDNNTIDWPDNFMTRMLAGYDVYHLPEGSLNHTHLQRAVSRLSELDLVFVLEDLGTSRELFDAVFGLAYVSPFTFRAGSSFSAHMNITEANLRRLRRREWLDLILYDACKLKSAWSLAAWRSITDKHPRLIIKRNMSLALVPPPSALPSSSIP